MWYQQDKRFKDRLFLSFGHYFNYMKDRSCDSSQCCSIRKPKPNRDTAWYMRKYYPVRLNFGAIEAVNSR